MAFDADIARHLRSVHGASTADEALRLEVGALLGVPAAAAQALKAISIVSVFDLASSRVFAVAADTPSNAPTSRRSASSAVEAPCTERRWRAISASKAIQASSVNRARGRTTNAAE